MGAARKDAVLASLGLRAEDATVQLRPPEGQEQPEEGAKRVPLSEVLSTGTNEEKREAHKAKTDVQSKLRDKVMCKVVWPSRHGWKILLKFVVAGKATVCFISLYHNTVNITVYAYHDHQQYVLMANKQCCVCGLCTACMPAAHLVSATQYSTI